MSKAAIFIAGALAGIIAAGLIAVIVNGSNAETRAAILDTHTRVKRICDVMEADRKAIDARADAALKAVREMDQK